MDYFNDLLAPFLSFDRVRILAVCGRIRKLTGCIKDILTCVPKINDGISGLKIDFNLV